MSCCPVFLRLNNLFSKVVFGASTSVLYTVRSCAYLIARVLITLCGAVLERFYIFYGIWFDFEVLYMLPQHAPLLTPHYYQTEASKNRPRTKL